MNPWRLIETAPTETWIEVCGDSGYLGCRWFIAIAKHDAEYRPRDPWIGVQYDCLSEHGWKPLYWRRLNSFPRKEP